MPDARIAQQSSGDLFKDPLRIMILINEGENLCNFPITHQWLQSCPYLEDLLLCFLVSHWQLHDAEIYVIAKASLGQLLCLQKNHHGIVRALDFSDWDKESG